MSKFEKFEQVPEELNHRMAHIAEVVAKDMMNGVYGLGNGPLIGMYPAILDDGTGNEMMVFCAGELVAEDGDRVGVDPLFILLNEELSERLTLPTKEDADELDR